jgi:hypothetical protein
MLPDANGCVEFLKLLVFEPKGDDRVILPFKKTGESCMY